MKYSKGLGFEYNRKYFCGRVESSDIRGATKEEYDFALEQYKKNKKCSHNIVHDEAGFMYDFRTCAICGKGLGLI